MSDCCSSNQCGVSEKKTHCCPVNGIEYQQVSARTIKHHIKQSWDWEPGSRIYYFCDDPACDVVYFADDNTTLLTSDLRNEVGIKATDDNALACYCFGISKAEAMSNPTVRQYVIDQTKNDECSCETSNPSGRCCLKDFPRIKTS